MKKYTEPLGDMCHATYGTRYHTHPHKASQRQMQPQRNEGEGELLPIFPVSQKDMDPTKHSSRGSRKKNLNGAPGSMMLTLALVMWNFPKIRGLHIDPEY